MPLKRKDHVAVASRLGFPVSDEMEELRSLRLIYDSAPPLVWTWQDWIANGHLNLIAAPSSAGKSFALLAFVKCLVTACAWPDGQPAPPWCPANVIYLDYEYMEGVMGLRAISLGLPLERVFMQPSYKLPYLTDPASLGRICAWIEAYSACMVVIDSWRRSTPGLTENDSDGTIQYAAPLTQIACEYGIPFMASCHTRKVRDGDRWTLTLDDVRGSSALADVARSVLVVEKPSAASETRRLRVEKSTFCTRPAPLYFTMKQGDGETGLSWVDGSEMEATHRQRSPVVPVSVPASQIITTALASGPLSDAALNELRPQGTKPDSFSRQLRRLAERGPGGLWKLKDAKGSA